MNGTTVKSKDILSSRSLKDRDYRVVPMDFKRPDKFSKEQIRTLQLMHETFSRLCERTLAVALRAPVKMAVAAVDQMSYGEFIGSLPDHTLMAITGMKPLKGYAIVEMDPKVVSALIDRLYGGAGKNDEEAREISAVQRAVLEPLFDRILKDLGVAWQTVCPLEPSLGQLETNPQFAQIVPPSEMVITISIPIELGEASGFINVCVPFITLEPVIKRLSAQFWYSSVRRGGKGELSPRIISRVKADGEIVADGGRLSLKCLGALEKGSLIKLEDFDQKPLTLRLGGEAVANLRAGRKGKGLFYEFADSPGASVLSALFPDQDNETDPLKESMKELSERIDRSYTDLTERFEKLSERQDLMDGRALLGDGGRKEFSTSEPFAFLLPSELDSLYPMLKDEHRQISAFILSRLDSSRGSALLALFSTQAQIDLVKRISGIERMAPEVVDLTAAWYEGQFTPDGDERGAEPEGLARVVDLLNNSSRSVERDVINTLDLEDPELSEEIKKRMFVFEDVVLLEGKVIRLLYERANRNDMLLAMKGVDDLVRAHIYHQLNDSEKEKLSAGLEEMGRVRLSEVDQAQQRIIGLIKEMEENGEVFIARSDEEVI